MRSTFFRCKWLAGLILSAAGTVLATEASNTNATTKPIPPVVSRVVAPRGAMLVRPKETAIEVAKQVAADPTPRAGVKPLSPDLKSETLVTPRVSKPDRQVQRSYRIEPTRHLEIRRLLEVAHPRIGK